jgi:hypothetical protein
MIFRSHHQTLTTFLLKIRERESELFEKRPGWHGGEPRKESGDVLGRSGECPKRNPQGEGLFLRESKRKRDGWCLGRVWEERDCLTYLLAARSHLRTARADSLRGARTVRHPGADGLLFHPEPRVPLQAPSTHADSPRRTGGRSAEYGRAVRPTAADSPTSLFHFSLIYSEIRIWIWIFWDHCSWIKKETFHMMQYS